MLWKLSPHRLLKALFSTSKSHVYQCLSTWRIPKCFSEFFIYNYTIHWEIGPLQVVDKKNGYRISLTKNCIYTSHEGRKIKTDNMSNPFQKTHGFHVTMIYILWQVRVGGGREGEGRKTKKKLNENWEAYNNSNDFFYYSKKYTSKLRSS